MVVDLVVVADRRRWLGAGKVDHCHLVVVEAAAGADTVVVGGEVRRRRTEPRRDERETRLILER